MRKIVILLTGLVFASLVFAQVPQGINYQALVRDAEGNPDPLKSVTIQIALKNGPGGVDIY